MWILLAMQLHNGEKVDQLDAKASTLPYVFALRVSEEVARRLHFKDALGIAPLAQAQMLTMKSIWKPAHPAPITVVGDT